MSISTWGKLYSPLAEVAVSSMNDVGKYILLIIYRNFHAHRDN
jgi:hypothetical protein